MQNNLSERFLEFGAWLRLIQKASLLSNSNPLLAGLLEENSQLINIIAKSVITAKQNK